MKSNASLNLLKKMLEIYSPSGKEGALALFLKEKMEEYGFKNVRIDRAGNVFGEVGSGYPRLLLCGHMDTIPGYLPVRVEGGRIYGRGAVDAKSSLAAMISASSRIRVKEKKGKTIVACVVEEERRARGIRQVLKEKMDVDYAIFGEPSGVNNITIGYKGSINVKLSCRTEAGHVGAKDAFKNAIEEAYGIWTRLRQISPRKKIYSNSAFNSITASLTGIRGGEAFNIIPSTCNLQINVRLPPNICCEKCVKFLGEIVRQHELENLEVKVKMRIFDCVEPFVADKNTVLIKALRKAIAKTVGVPIKLLKKTGTGDMNIFATKVKIPIATYGPGNSHLSHTSNEFVEIVEYLNSVEIYGRTIEELLGKN